MIILEFLVVLGAVFLGARLGGMAIGFAGGLGVLVLAALRLTPGALPLDVIAIVVAVITAIAAMQITGGMTYLVQLAERILRSNPKHLTFLAPLITYLMTLMAPGASAALHTSQGGDDPVLEAGLPALPDPLARYLRRARVLGQPRPHSFYGRLHRRIRSGAEQPWMSFTGRQVNTFGAAPTRTFLMHATRAGLPVTVLHVFGRGQATMRGKVLSPIPVMDASGPEVDRVRPSPCSTTWRCSHLPRFWLRPSSGPACRTTRFTALSPAARKWCPRSCASTLVTNWSTSSPTTV